ITYLTKQARKMLDDAGLPQATICVSNSLDEYIIEDIIRQGACIDSFGVGERLITAKSEPVFGCVYKLAAVEEDGKIIPKIKISENVQKITNPHFKKVYRIFERESGKAIADQICIHDEEMDDTKPLMLFDPEATWKKKLMTDYTAKPLLVPIFLNGELVYEQPSLDEIRKYSFEQRDLLWEEVKRFENPHNYYVDLSEKLWNTKRELLEKLR
ncbi:MAG: nicotinate phosphoribosyltransferase, partial [Oscillospiraceae bacterium]|nr:nicotinate phosphoribosyltransferase [Oscillospiraceae bacterium]